MEDLSLVVRFKEVPPGSRAQATITAFTTTALIGVVGFLVSEGRVSPGSDYPAVILALPAVAASYFGFTTDRKGVVGGSLLARLSLIVSGVVSLTCMVTYLMTAPSGQSNPAAAYHAAWSIVGITRPEWKLLFVVSLFNFLYVYYRFGLKLVYYGGLSRRPQGPGLSAASD